MQQREALIRKLQSATASLETIQAQYQDKAAPLALIEPLHAVMEMLQEIHREVVLQELRSNVLNADMPAAIRKEKGGALFQLLLRQKRAR